MFRENCRFKINSDICHSNIKNSIMENTITTTNVQTITWSEIPKSEKENAIWVADPNSHHWFKFDQTWWPASLLNNPEMQSRIASYQAQLKELQKQEAYRADNYFNCVDDYSWGGPCSKANWNAQGKCQQAIQYLIEMADNGGFMEQTFIQSVLMTLDGQVVSEKIIFGKFGPCFIIGEGQTAQFISIPKKMATLQKKGFKMGIKSIPAKFTFQGYSQNDKAKWGLISWGQEMMLDALDTTIHQQNSIHWWLTNVSSK